MIQFDFLHNKAYLRECNGEYSCLQPNLTIIIMCSIIVLELTVYLYFIILPSTGIGLGLIYVPAVVFISIYFENKRSLATGIASSGSGIGTIIFAPLSQILLDTYGWRGMVELGT